MRSRIYEGEPPAYAELHCLSNFTFLRGASHPHELVTTAHRLGYQALAITDECSLAGAVRAHQAAQPLGFHLIIGTELSLIDGPKLVVLADSLEAYQQLSALITQGRRRVEKGGYALYRRDVEALSEGLILWIPQDDLEQNVEWLARRFSRRAWLAVECFYEGGDIERLGQLRVLAQHAQLPLVAAGDVHMHRRSRQSLQDTLTAIRFGMPLEGVGKALFMNGERHLRSRARLPKIYPPDLIAESIKIAKRCHFSLTELHYEYPHELVPPGETPTTHLRHLTEVGMQQRWPQGISPKVRALIEHELKMIAELAYEAFFLTVYDIVCFARTQGILCQGRGSAANSAVCYALGITEVDPARMEMLFERFISKERNEPPDIDVDFEHERREEVIQYIYDKYGRSRAAIAATVITYKMRSAIRDVGKALGFDLEQVDRLAKNVFWWDGKCAIPERLQEVGFDINNRKIQHLLRLLSEIIGFPRHLSQHVGGFVISDQPLSNWVPIENASMPERTVIQWDKDDLEALGLLKVDCLCLGMLSAIRKTFDLIEGFDGRRLSMATLPAEDPETYQMIQHGDTVGVFQIESRAQMAMLPRLKPANYYDLVIEVAIIRPGPIQGEMVHPYLRRRNGEEAVTYPSKDVEDVLKRTLGVPLFQEQVIKLAMVAAGFTPGEADQLRRSMASWKRNGGLEHFRTRLIEGMSERGYNEEFAERIFNQIQGFGEYGFPESHAASFALLAYVSAWLKCHEPAAFTAGLINSLPMGFYAPAQLIQDVRRHGVFVRPANVLHSDWNCTLECDGFQSGKAVLRLGLRLVKSFSQAAAERLMAAREKALFRSVSDLARRAKLDRGDMKALSDGGALQQLIGNRHQASWAALGIEPEIPILPGAEVREGTPMLRRPTEGQDLVADYASLGLTLGRHPLALLRQRLDQQGFVNGAIIGQMRHGEAVKTIGLVVTRQRPGTATGVVFITLEDEIGAINVVVWSSLVESQRREVLGARLLGVQGEVQRDGEVIHVIAERLYDHSSWLGSLMTQSRDFH
ncbi:MAG: error-prone DNA polymerase [Pseudomonadota bacterium]